MKFIQFKNIQSYVSIVLSVTVIVVIAVMLIYLQFELKNLGKKDTYTLVENITENYAHSIETELEKLTNMILFGSRVIKQYQKQTQQEIYLFLILI